MLRMRQIYGRVRFIDESDALDALDLWMGLIGGCVCEYYWEGVLYSSMAELIILSVVSLYKSSSITLIEMVNIQLSQSINVKKYENISSD